MLKTADETPGQGSLSERVEYTLPVREAWPALKREFRCRNLLMNGELTFGRVNWIRGFGCSRWGAIPPPVFVVYRLAWGGIMFGIFVWSVATSYDSNTGRGWLAYLTHWALLAMMLAGVFTAIATVTSNYVFDPDSEVWRTQRAPFYYVIAWVATEIGIPVGLGVVILYWALLASGPGDALNAFVHGIVWGLLVFDFLIMGQQPWLVPQSLWAIVYGLAYSIWSVIFSKSGLTLPSSSGADKTAIYPVLDWNTPNKTVSAAIYSFGFSIVILPLFCSAFWCLGAVRKQAILISEGPGASSSS